MHLLVVSLHQSDTLIDTVLRCIIVYYTIIQRASLPKQWTLEEMVYPLGCFITRSYGLIIFYIFRPFHDAAHLLRHFHSDHVSDDVTLARDLLGVCISLWGTYCRWLDHSTIRRENGMTISSSVDWTYPAVV